MCVYDINDTSVVHVVTDDASILGFSEDIIDADGSYRPQGDGNIFRSVCLSTGGGCFNPSRPHSPSMQTPQYADSPQ